MGAIISYYFFSRAQKKILQGTDRDSVSIRLSVVGKKEQLVLPGIRTNR
jgi:hypothetical protein